MVLHLPRSQELSGPCRGNCGRRRGDHCRTRRGRTRQGGQPHLQFRGRPELRHPARLLRRAGRLHALPRSRYGQGLRRPAVRSKESGQACHAHRAEVQPGRQHGPLADSPTEVPLSSRAIQGQPRPRRNQLRPLRLAFRPRLQTPQLPSFEGMIAPSGSTGFQKVHIAIMD